MVHFIDIVVYSTSGPPVPSQHGCLGLKSRRSEEAPDEGSRSDREDSAVAAIQSAVCKLETARTHWLQLIRSWAGRRSRKTGLNGASACCHGPERGGPAVISQISSP